MSEPFYKTAFKEIIQEIRTQNLTKHVRTFHGEGTPKFVNWLQDMDQLSITSDSERMCVLATLTLGGMAGTYASRLIQENSAITWQILRQKLRERFLDASDPFYAQEQCRQMRQKPEESTQNFAERLRTAALDAFDNMASPDTQRTLVEIFQKGVRSDRLSLALIKKRFQNLDQAVEFAVSEDRADKIFRLYRGKQAPEPMDIDAIRTDDRLDKLQANIDQLTDRLDNMTKPTNPQHSSRLRSQGPPFRPVRHQSAPPRFRHVPRRHQTVPIRPHTSAAEPPPHQPSQQIPRTDSRDRPTGPYHPPAEPPSAASPSASRVPRIRPYRWTPDGRPICARCGKVGHVYRQCRNLEN